MNIRELDRELHAFLEVIDNPESSGSGPLAGVTVALKDNICMRGTRTTAGSRILENFLPPYDATVVEKLRSAGAIIVGKTNLDEFAMGSSTENSAFGPTRNPWNKDCVPGGSSGGSAAAVAAGMVRIALGSDTGGSIRQPAALCGITGMKPTYGRVSRYGLIAYGSSLDQIGPLAVTAQDCALMMSVISGHDPRDSTSAQHPVPDFVGELAQPVQGLKLGVIPELLGDLDAENRANFEASVKTLQGLGCQTVEVQVPSLKYGLSAYYLIATAEASSNLARYDGVRYGHRAEGPDVARMMKKTRAEGFGAEVKRRILLGTYALSAGYYDAYYHKAQKVRTMLRNEFEAAFSKVDVVLTPATPTPAFRIGEKVQNPLEMYLQDIYTVAANLTGFPGLVVPNGAVKGLPTGLQMLGRAWEEALLLRLGHHYQQATDFHTKLPVLSLSKS